MRELPQGFVEQTWLYAGKRLMSDGKMFECWVDTQGDEHLLGTKVNGPVGAGYAVVVSEDLKTMYTKGALGPRYAHQPEKGPSRELWAAKDRADQATHEMRQLEAREKKKGDPLHELCEPLRELYRSAAFPARRAALLATIIEEVTRPGR